MARKSSSEKELEAMPFEKALARLEEIVSRMEQGDLSLEEMLTHYEEGNRLSRLCGEKLSRFEKKIELLTRETAAGGEWEEFDPESGRRVPTCPETAAFPAGDEPEETGEPDSDDEADPNRNDNDLLF